MKVNFHVYIWIDNVIYLSIDVEYFSTPSKEILEPFLQSILLIPKKKFIFSNLLLLFNGFKLIDCWTG
jgi:hypothetical protein